MAHVTKINEFMSRIGVKGGMSLTSGFDISFDFSKAKFRSPFYRTGSTEEEVIHMLCDEAQLPNVQSATGNIEGRYLGEGSVAYPHTRIFTDVGLGFLCDAQLTPLKFFQHWYDYIYSEAPIAQIGNYEGARGSIVPQRNRVNRLRYMEDYVATIRIMKTEPNGRSSSGRAPVTYMLENAYPYSIDSVPLAYGTSQVTRVNVNFYYSRHSVAYAQNKRLEADDMDFDDENFGNKGLTSDSSGMIRGG